MIFTEGTRSVEDIQGFVKHTLHELAADTGYHWGIVHQGRLAGILGAGGVDRNSQKVEIGYWLAAEFQGKEADDAGRAGDAGVSIHYCRTQ